MTRPKLLLADDSITIQKVVNLTFADHGIEVVTFADGDSAIESFDEVKPDIVLADVNMPGLNGYQICELLRSDAASSNIPVVLLVGSFEPFDREEAERVGASAHLTKPFNSIAELIATVDGLLATPEPTPAAAVEETDNSAATRPETSDIDHLYEQSFVETVEIPQDAVADYEFEPVDLDDEMIQTSYVGEGSGNGPDPANPEPVAVTAEEDAGLQTASEHSFDDAESLIAESMPKHEEPEQPAAFSESRSSDPFASPAADLPPVGNFESQPGEDAIKFDFDDSDLLELPSSGSRGAERPAAVSAPGPGVITSLSPELIELIVEKVVERLAQRAEGSAVRSNTHS